MSVAAAAVLGAIAAFAATGAGGGSSSGRGGSGSDSAVPVEVARIESGAIERVRVFSGSMESAARVTIAPNVGGRVVSVEYEIADEITRGSVVARLDAEEFAQAVAQAEAELAVAGASVAEAEARAAIAETEFDRIAELFADRMVSASEHDALRADWLAADAAVKIAEARETRAASQLESANIRLRYTEVRAEWATGDDARVVAERFVEEGDTISANTPVLSVVELDPIEAVIFATQRDYALLEAGQAVTVTTDGYPGRTWPGAVARVSPVFRSGSRQARVEISVPNEGGLLKPGMFVRVRATLETADAASIVPASAVTRRDGRDVIFVVRDGVARRVAVETGIEQGERVALAGEGVSAGDLVVTLGQQLIDDGTELIFEAPGGAATGGEAAQAARE